MKSERLLPVAPFREILLRRLNELEQSGEAAPRAALAKQARITTRAVLRTLLEQEYLNFDTADKIVTHIEGPMAWHEREDLNELYWSVDLSVPQKRSETHCRNGHERAVYGRYSDGCCKRCKLERGRRNQINKSGKTRKKRVAA